MSLIFAVLGWITGVVVNSLADSLPRRQAWRGPRCDQCGAPRSLEGASGILGSIAGSDRCLYCGSRRKSRALVVELVLTLTFVALASSRPVPQALAAALVVGLFSLIAVIDLEHRLILHVVSLPAATAIAAVGILDPGRGVLKTLLGGAVGAGIVLVMYLGGVGFSWALARLRGRDLDEIAFGFGDVTLAAVVGVTVGWPGVIPAILVGVFAAGVYSLLYLTASLLQRRYVAFTPIPYGPFLILGALAVYFGWFSAVAQPASGP